MKKKTAITLGALALLVSGVTFGGFRIKEKKEKDKIEKELKEILIPNAEKELDALTKQHSDLNDSITYYANQIEMLTQDTLISEADAKEISKLLSDIQKDLSSSYSKWTKKYEKYYEGEGEYDYDRMPKEGVKQSDYLAGGILKKFAKDSSWYVPGYEEEYFVDVPPAYSDREVKSGYRKVRIGRIEEYRESSIYAKAGGYDTYVEHVMASLQESLSQIEDFNFSEQEQLLRTLESFVKNIDNSRGVIKPETLRKLGVIVKTSLKRVEYDKLTKAKDKKESFSKAKSNLEFKLAAAERKVQKYKQPDMVKQMYKQKVRTGRK